MIKSKKLPATFYPVSITVLVADNWDEVDKKYGTESSKETMAKVFAYGGNQIYVAFIKDKFQLNFIPHESVHIISEIYDYIGAKPDSNNDEHYAYLMGWLFDEIYKFVSQYIIKSPPICT